MTSGKLSQRLQDERAASWHSREGSSSARCTAGGFGVFSFPPVRLRGAPLQPRRLSIRPRRIGVSVRARIGRVRCRPEARVVDAITRRSQTVPFAMTAGSGNGIHTPHMLCIYAVPLWAVRASRGCAGSLRPGSETDGWTRRVRHAYHAARARHARLVSTATDRAASPARASHRWRNGTSATPASAGYGGAHSLGAQAG